MPPTRKPNPHLGVGCDSYVTVVYPLKVSFPADCVVCDFCEFCHSENSGTRFRCYLTGEILPYHNAVTGLRCPLDLPKPNTNEEVISDAAV